MAKVICHKCSYIFSFNEVLSRTSSCENCHSDLKVCLNCSFFDIRASKQCLENQTSLVSDKEKANFCEWFVPSQTEKEKNCQKQKKLSELGKLFKEPDETENDNKKLDLESFFKK